MSSVSGQPPLTTVVHLLHSVAYGGIETIVVNWMERFDPERFRVHLVVFANADGSEGPFVRAATQHGLTVHTIPWARRKPLVKAARMLARLLRGWQADILHTHGYYADMVGVIAGRLAPVRTIVTLYVFIERGLNWKRSVLQTLDAWAVRWFDRITVHCEATGAAAIARGIPERRLETLICGYEPQPSTLAPDVRCARRAALGAGDAELVLVNVARLYPEKTQDALLRMFATIHAHAPHTRLWIAGVGPLEVELRVLSTRLGLDGVVRFLGFVDNLAELLACCDVQVHPAAIEGVPLAVCAGMVAELPVVASAVGGIPEVVKNERTGLLVPAGDEAAFVAAVLRLVGDPAERRRLGTTARRFVEDEYSLDVAVARVERTYEAMLRAPRA